MDDATERRAEVAEAGHRGDVATARAALDDADAAVRAVAVGALRRAGALDAAVAATAMADASPAVRRRIVEEVAALGGLTGVSLLPLLADDDATVVEVTAWACGELDPPEPDAVAHLVALTTGHADALVREAAVAALGAIGDDAGLDAVLAATTDKATVRRRAVIALAAFEGPEVDTARQRALTDRDWQVRQAAEDQTR